MQKFVEWFNKAWIVLLVTGIVIALDQWTKTLVRQNIPKNSYTIPIPSLGEYFYFEHVDNYGAAFGILQNMGNLFVVIAAVVAVAILLYVRYLPPDQWLVRILLGLQLGGAMGNVVDRISRGYVTDFIKTGIPDFYYIPNYNIADSCIVTGVISLAVYILWDDLRKQRQQQAEPTSENVST